MNPLDNASPSTLLAFDWVKTKNEEGTTFFDHNGRTWSVIGKMSGGIKKLSILECGEEKICLWMPRTREEQSEGGLKLSLEKRDKLRKQCDDEVKVWEKIASLACFSCATVYGVVNYMGKDETPRQAVRMKYYPKGDFLDYYKKTDFLQPTPSFIEQFTERILTILAELWEKGKIVHKDIKMENLLVEKMPGGPEAYELKVTDFGFAVFDADQEVAASAVKHMRGSPPFIAPEIMFKEKVYPEKVDVFSAGVVLLLIIGGGDEKSARAVVSYLNKIRGLKSCSSFRQLHIRYQDCARSFSLSEEKIYQLVGKMLARDPVQRPTAQQALEELKLIMVSKEGGGE